jgi:hypothetical protein
VDWAGRITALIRAIRMTRMKKSEHIELIDLEPFDFHVCDFDFEIFVLTWSNYELIFALLSWTKHTKVVLEPEPVPVIRVSDRYEVVHADIILRHRVYRSLVDPPLVIPEHERVLVDHANVFKESSNEGTLQKHTNAAFEYILIVNFRRKYKTGWELVLDCLFYKLELKR